MPARLRALADDPHLGRLWERARTRMEATGGQLDGASVSLPGASDEERRAVELLLGVTKRGKGLKIPLTQLDAVLRASRVGVGLADLLERTGGPLRDRPAERAREQDAEERLWREAADHPALGLFPELSTWLDHVRAVGYLRRISAGDPAGLLRGALDVLARLPSPGIGRAVLACEVFSEAHALDDDRPVTRLILSALAQLSGFPPPGGAAARRGLLDQFGVLCDETSSSVLVHGLRPEPRGPLTRAFGLFCDAGVPFRVTLQMLHLEPWICQATEQVRICENPAVISAASDRYGAGCEPILCTEGMPSVATRRLLTMLVGARVRLLYHGDFDAWGIRIANLIISGYDARPWRFDSQEYGRCLERGLGVEVAQWHRAEACWDRELGDLMSRRGVEIHEEQVLEDLLGDLGAQPPGGLGKAPLPGLA